MRHLVWIVALASLLALVSPALAVIIRLTALAEVIDESTYIVAATIEKLDPDRPSLVLKIDDKLKGKPPFTSMPVLIKGDAGAIKRKESPQLLARVADKLPVVVFINKADDEYTAFGYTNGTWFSMAGVKVDGEWRWTFSHLEPYLRRTYKGTTKEMVQTVKDALSGKGKPPKPDEKEKAGLGPVVPKKTGALDREEPRYAVIPTVLVGGPLVMLAMLFPTAFGGWRRWFALLSIAGTNSTLYTLHWWFADSLAGTWWGSPVTLWAVMGVINVFGVVWAWQRHLALVQAGEAPGRPGFVEVIVLAIVSGIGITALAIFELLEQKLLSPEWLPLVAFCAAVCIGFLYAVYARLRKPRMTPAVATEAVVLTGLAAVSLLLGTALQTRASSGRFERGDQAKGEESVKVKWKFRLPGKGGFASTPLVHGEHVYIAAANDHAFRPYGTLYCLDRGTGEEKWSFSDKKKMKPVYSSPVIVAGKLYIGEGFHQDEKCKVYCLEASSGKKLWDFETESHTESTPAIVDGRIYIGAGDDGLYCLDASSGKVIWNFPAFHIDAPPRVAGRRVYAGCGIGDVYKTTAFFCLDSQSGSVKTPPRILWRINTDLPVWGRPIVSNGFVYIGTGNGRVNEAAERPAGEVMCLREENGDIVWKKKFPDGILASLTADRRHVYFGCRDGFVYALRRRDGELSWRRELGSPVVSTPATEGTNEDAPAGRMVAVALAGELMCMDSQSGKLIWSRDLSALANSAVEVIANPVMETSRDAEGAEVWRLYVGVTMISTGRAGELYCLEDRTLAQE